MRQACDVHQCVKHRWRHCFRPAEIAKHGGGREGSVDLGHAGFGYARLVRVRLASVMKLRALASWFSTPVAKWGVVAFLAGAIGSAIAAPNPVSKRAEGGLCPTQPPSERAGTESYPRFITGGFQDDEGLGIKKIHCQFQACSLPTIEVVLGNNVSNRLALPALLQWGSFLINLLIRAKPSRNAGNCEC